MMSRYCIAVLSLLAFLVFGAHAKGQEPAKDGSTREFACADYVLKARFKRQQDESGLSSIDFTLARRRDSKVVVSSNAEAVNFDHMMVNGEGQYLWELPTSEADYVLFSLSSQFGWRSLLVCVRIMEGATGPVGKISVYNYLYATLLAQESLITYCEGWGPVPPDKWEQYKDPYFLDAIVRNLSTGEVINWSPIKGDAGNAIYRWEGASNLGNSDYLAFRKKLAAQLQQHFESVCKALKVEGG